MTFFDRLGSETAPERDKFLAVPLLQEALSEGVDRRLYCDYLGQAYHHVRHTCPLLAAAASRCGQDDVLLRDALFEYIDEEKGHERWILDDLRAVGSDAEVSRVTSYEGDPAVRALVGYVYYAIDRISPYALLGMVYVLEGTSTEIATNAAKAIAGRLGVAPAEGFSYLLSHGAIDRDHIVFFRNLVNRIDDPEKQRIIIDAANMVYNLWGQMFSNLVASWQEHRNAA